MTTSTCKLLATVALSLVAFASVAGQQPFDKRFTAVPGGRLTLDTEAGSVAIIGRDTHEVVVHADMSDFDHLQIAAEKNASGVLVIGRVTHRNWLDWVDISPSHVHFTMAMSRLPRQEAAYAPSRAAIAA